MHKHTFVFCVLYLKSRRPQTLVGFCNNPNHDESCKNFWQKHPLWLPS